MAPLGPASALETFCGASNGRRHALIAPFDYTKKNACNRRLNHRLGGRNRDITRLKSSFIPPVRSLEAWGAQRSELRTCRNDRNPAYLCANPLRRKRTKCKPHADEQLFVPRCRPRGMRSRRARSVESSSHEFCTRGYARAASSDVPLSGTAQTRRHS